MGQLCMYFKQFWRRSRNMSINFTFVKLFSHKIDILDKETITLSASEPSNLINSKTLSNKVEQ